MIILPLWFPTGTGTNPDWAEGWNSALTEVMKRLDEANIPYKMEEKFGEGSPNSYKNVARQSVIGQRPRTTDKKRLACCLCYRGQQG